MAKKKYEESNIQAIAETIRSKTGTDTTYDTSEMASGVNEVYDKGRTDEWSDFWDVFQHNGERTYYYYAFYKGSKSQKSIWTDENFKPKYDITPVGDASNMFYGCNFTDFKGICEKQGITFDTSGVTRAQALFGECYWLTRLPELDLKNATRQNGLFTSFSYCEELTSIDMIILNDNGEQTFGNTFNACKKLTDIKFEGVIGKDISFSHSPLSVESMKNIILHLANYAGTANAGAYTLTLKDECKTAMSELGAIPEFNNKTYDAYLTDIGWNLA